MRTLTRRSAIVSVSALALAPRAARPAGNDTVRFGLLHPNLTTVIHEIAKRTGAYNRQNVTVVETRFKSGQTVEGVEQLWRGNLDFYMGGAPEIPRLNSRIIEGGGAPALAVVSGANPGHTSLVLGNKLNPRSIDEILKDRLRIAVSSLSSVHAWRMIVAAEMLASESGIGSVLMESRYQFRATDLMMAMALISVVGYLTERLIVGTIEKKTIERWEVKLI
jgi:ABC-type nitrate/sulfonate/bicarbonate transport system substrate-binding protein